MPFFTFSDIPVQEAMPGFFGRLTRSENMTLASWDILKNSELAEHSHPEEQVLLMLSGEFLFRLGEEERLLRAGDSVIIPGNVKHSGQALTDCRIIDVFSPARPDFTYPEFPSSK